MKTANLLLTAALCLNGFTSCMAGNSKKITETRNVQPYSSIQMDGVASVHFTQDNTCSIRVEGEEEQIKDLITYVKNGKLIIDQKTNKKKNNNGVDVYLTAPTLEEVSFDGVGSFKCPQTLKVEDIRFDINGVGSVEVADLYCRSLHLDVDGVGNTEIHTDCSSIEADFDGVGSNKLSGKADRVHVRKDGVGSTRIDIDCHDLKAELDGIGKTTFSGKADQADIKKDGMGSCSTSGLKVGSK